eukprot:10328834-Alexandrium_andersonii.AAC.1
MVRQLRGTSGAFEMLNWVRRRGAQAPTFLRGMEERIGPAPLSAFHVEHAPFAGLIMTDLALKTTDKARRLLMAMPEADDGREAQRRLSH